MVILIFHGRWNYANETWCSGSRKFLGCLGKTHACPSMKSKPRERLGLCHLGTFLESSDPGIWGYLFYSEGCVAAPCLFSPLRMKHKAWWGSMSFGGTSHLGTSFEWGFPGGSRASLIAQLVKNLPAMQETPVWFLGQEDLLGKG